MISLKNIAGFRRTTLCLSLALSSVVGAIDQESRPQEGGGIAQAIGHVARRCFGTKWYNDVPVAASTRDDVTPAMRTSPT